MTYDPTYGVNRFRSMLENPDQLRQNPMAALGGIFGMMAPQFSQHLDRAGQVFGQMPGLGMMFGGGGGFGSLSGGFGDLQGFAPRPQYGPGGITTTTTLADGTVMPATGAPATPSSPSGMPPLGGYPTQGGYGGGQRQSSYGGGWGGYGRRGDSLSDSLSGLNDGGNAMSRIYGRRSAY